MKLLPILIAAIGITLATANTQSRWDRLIIERMLTSVSPSDTINVYVKKQADRDILKVSKQLHVVPSCEEADFELIYPGQKLVCEKPAIVFSFQQFRKTPNAIGVFFWQKGRPTLRFSSQRLAHYHLHVKGELSHFVSTTY